MKATENLKENEMAKQEQITKLENQIANARKLAYNASQMRNAKSYGRIERQLEEMYRKLDNLLKSS